MEKAVLGPIRLILEKYLVFQKLYLTFCRNDYIM
jgi:hypothetical protein